MSCLWQKTGELFCLICEALLKGAQGPIFKVKLVFCYQRSPILPERHFAHNSKHRDGV